MANAAHPHVPESTQWYRDNAIEGSNESPERKWEQWEDDLVLAKEGPDIDLGRRIKRSLHAIHGRRSALKKGYKQAHGCRVW